MRIWNHIRIAEPNRSRTIMLFGRAKLVRTAEGKLVLEGATKDEQTEAKEYISMFMQEAAVSFGE